jgi:hypothetical protein
MARSDCIHCGIATLMMCLAVGTLGSTSGRRGEELLAPPGTSPGRPSAFQPLAGWDG